MSNRNITITIVSVVVMLGCFYSVIAAPQNSGNIFRNITPEADDTYYNATTTIQWKETHSDEYCIDGNCIDSWGSAYVSELGFSTSTYDGDISYGGFDGYEAGDEICNADNAGFHLCSADEMGYWIQNNATSTLSGTSWVKEYAPGYTTNANDCNGFTSNNNTYYGAFADMTGGVTSETVSYWLTNCSNAKKLTCCK